MKRYLLVIIILLLAALNASSQCFSPANHDQTVCINEAITDIIFNTVDVTDATVTDLPADVTFNWTSPTLTITGTPKTAGSHLYTVTFTGTGGCTTTGTINVTADNAAGAPSSNPSVCINAPITDITIVTTGATGIGSAIDLPDGLTPSWSSNLITITGTPTESGTFNYSIPLTGGCGTVNATGTIIVNPVNAAASPATHSVCINKPLTPITIATTGATGIGAVTGLPPGLSADWDANVITISGTPAESNTFNYSIPLSGGCGSVNATGTIIVNPVNTAAAPVTNSACINTLITSITIATTGATGIGSPVNLPNGLNAVWSADKITISGTPAESGTFLYSIPLIGGCGTVNATGTIIVNNLPTLNDVDQVNTSCSGSPGRFLVKGLIAGSTSTVYYKIDSGSEQSVSGLVADGSGRAEFNSINLFAGDVKLYITGIRNASTLCRKDITGESVTLDIRNTVVTGPSEVCANVSGNEYETNIYSATYNWTIVGGTINSGQGTRKVSVTWTGPGHLYVVCTRDGLTCSSSNYPVIVKPSDPATITGDLVVNMDTPFTYETLTGQLSYNWLINGGAPVTGDGSSITVNWENQPSAHTISVSYISTNGCPSSSGPKNVTVRPSVSNVTITGYPSVGSSLEPSYVYKDGSTGMDASSYRWFRDGIQISTSKIYVAQPIDYNKILSCEVTPVSSLHINTGTPVIASSEPIEDLSHPEIKPVAENVCIEGKREKNNVLRGKYHYNYPYKDEGNSTYRWIRMNGAVEEKSTPGLEYTLTEEDLADGREIYFEVTPFSSNSTPIQGLPVKSDPLPKITNLEDYYAVSAPDVNLTTNVAGGIFDGPGISGNLFSPAAAGIGTFQISFIKIIDNLSHVCTQRAPETVVIAENPFSFDPVINAHYCSYDLPFNVTVNPIPAGATDITVDCLNKDKISDMNGITYIPDFSIKVDPSLMSEGKHTLIMAFLFDDPSDVPDRGLMRYIVRKEFVIERVSRTIKFVGLKDNYCENEAASYVSVDGIFRPDGTGFWEITGPTSDILTDKERTSANLVPDNGTPGLPYNIRYHYVAPLGCVSNTIDNNITIQLLPDPAFSLDSTYNVEGHEHDLDPVTTKGGIFKGDGIAGNFFFPEIAGEGRKKITHTVTDLNQCTDSLKAYTVVRKAAGSITGISQTVCYDNIDLNISAIGLPANSPPLSTVTTFGFSNTRKTLLTVPGVTTAVYSVPKAGEGVDTIYFSYNWDGVDYKISKIVNIDSIGKIHIYDLVQNQKFCDNSPEIPLNVSKTGGTFSGPVVDGIFKPSIAGLSDIIQYSYTNPKTGCTVDTAYNIRVYKKPLVNFIPADVCINDSKDTMRFVNKTTSTDPVVKWEWKFYDNATYPDSVAYTRDAGYPYLTGGTKTVSLMAETDKGCVMELPLNINIGRRPVADFTWKQDCFHAGEMLQLTDASAFTTPPRSWSWRYGGTEFNATRVASFPKTDTGYVSIEYIVRTDDYYQCNDTLVKNIYIRPSVEISADGYFTDFESGSKGWFVSDTSSIWSFGTPAGSMIKSAASGSKAWFTTNPRDGSSSIESPCFDLTYMQRPVFKLNLNKDMDKDRDGVALQYKVGDDPVWRYVGTIDDGIEWYNSATISGNPGGNSLGWTTAGASDGEYRNAVHTLDELRGKRDVKFRISYGSSGSYSDRDGFAFDDVFIGERSRQVLVEHFMSYASTKSMENKALVDSIVSQKERDVINVQYHTNLSGYDSLYNYNPGEINTRILFYGLTRVPYTFVDGGNNSLYNKLYDFSLNMPDTTEITKRTLVNSPFRLVIDPIISGRVLTVKGYIKSLENIDINNLTLFIIVTEKKTQGSYTGVPANTQFINVFRKFIPDAAGTVLKKTWLKGDSIPLPEQSWTVEKMLNSSDIEIIAFLQNTLTKEVYQAFSVVRPQVLVGIEDHSAHEVHFSLYPNPASDKITIHFGTPLRDNARIVIYSIKGEAVREYRAGKGLVEFTISDPALKDGLYLVRITIGLYDQGYQKLIITGD